MVMNPCPNCRAPAAPKYRPFCSLRCQQVDLGRWFSESYRVPVENPHEEELAPSGHGQDDADETSDC